MKTANEIFFYELAAMQDLEHQVRSILGLLIGTRIQDSTLKRIIEDMADASERHSDRIDACLRHLGTAPLQTRSAPIRGVQDDFQVFLRTPTTTPSVTCTLSTPLNASPSSPSPATKASPTGPPPSPP